MGAHALFTALAIEMAFVAVVGLPRPASAQPQNPPPASALVGYDKYELLPVAMSPPYAGDKGKEKARARVQEYITVETGALIAQWNQDAAGSARGQSLIFEPRIEKLRVVSSSARFWGGVFTGDSYVVMRLRIVEQPSGMQLAEPEFTQRADAFPGAWTFGAWDKDMLHRIVTLMNVYLKLNYKEAVGGPTGLDPK